jgi:hypothetical protein
MKKVVKLFSMLLRLMANKLECLKLVIFLTSLTNVKDYINAQPCLQTLGLAENNCQRQTLYLILQNFTEK